MLLGHDRSVIPTAAPAGALAQPTRWYRHLYPQVLAAIGAGILLGHFAPASGAALKPLADSFIALVKMVIPPVIFLTVTTGIAGLRNLREVGRIAAMALGYFLVLSTLALVIGLTVAHVIRPGAGLNIDPATLDAGKIADYAAKAHDASVSGFLSGIIPETFASALTSGNVLQVLLIAILFGIALSLSGPPGERLLAILNDLALVFFRIVALVMKAAPVGAFAAMAFTIGKYGLGAVASLAGLVVTFYLTALLFVLVVLGAVARAAGFSIVRLIVYLRTELLLVLGTSSSESALPSLIDKLERAGCPPGTVGLVVPLGYSFNLDGTNIYMTLAALFIAQACNVELTLGQQLLLLGVAMISSKGAAGVTGAGFITLAATLAIVPQVPVAGMALILGVDRFMSECRSLTNFVGNAVATVVIARWDGGLDRAALERALAKPAHGQ